MAQAVYTRQKRHQFIKGWLTGGSDPMDGSVECGDATQYSLEITGATARDKFDKIAEIFHRVKDAHFTGGRINLDNSGGVDVYISAPTAAPANRVLYTTAGVFPYDPYQTRGYFANDFADIDFPNLAPYFDPPYDRGDGVNQRDIGSNERGLYFFTLLTGTSLSSNLPFITELYHAYEEPILGPLPEWFNFESTSIPTFGGGIEALVSMSGKIAYVLSDPAHTIFHPDTRFFIDLIFDCSPVFWVSIYGNFSTNPRSSFGILSPIYMNCDYVMRLSTGDLRAKIYGESSFIPVPVGGDDIIHSAVKWFPYQKGSPPISAWDMNNGEKVPDDPSMLGFDDPDAGGGMALL